MQNKALEFAHSPRLPKDDSQAAHPHVASGDGIVRVRKIRLDARDDEVIAGFEFFGCWHVMCCVAIIFGRRQVCGPSQRGGSSNELIQVGLVESAGAPTIIGESGGPFYLDRAKVNFGDIAIGNTHHRQRIIPHSLGRDVDTFGFDVRDEIEAEFAANTLWKRVLSLHSNFASFYQFVFVLQHHGPAMSGRCRKFMLGIGFRKGL